MRRGPRIAALLCTLASSALAAPSATDKAVAESLFQEARKLMKQGALDRACPKFAESHRLAPRLGTLLNLATCHEKQGKTASAWAEFKEAAALARADQRKAREVYARQHAADLEKKLSRVTVEVDAPAEGTTVRLDGVEIGAAAWGTAVPVDPGTHELAASAPGRRAWSQSIVVEPGPSTLTVRVPALEREAAETATRQPPETPTTRGPEADRTSDGSAQRTLGWVAIGAGAVALGVGTWFGVRTFDKQNESEDHCAGTACDQTGVDLRDEARTSATISTIGFAVGVAGVGAGVVLLLTAGGDEPGARRVWIAPGVGSLSLGGRL
jgi:hypothetical protein